MQEILEAQATTRRGVTIHENISEQFNRLGSELWEDFAEKLAQNEKASNMPTFGYFAPPKLEDNLEMYYNSLGTYVRGELSYGLTIMLELKIRSFEEYLKGNTLLISTMLINLTRAKNETSFSDVFRSFAEQNDISIFKNRQSSSQNEWNEKKNQRRCELVDKEVEGTLSTIERIELEKLQAEMLAYRRKIAPLPLQELRELHQALLREVGSQSK